LAKFAPESQALRNLEARNDAPLDFLAGLSGSFTGSSIFAAGFGSVLLAPGPFILPAFSSGDFLLTLSHRFLKLSDLLA
jgi:hypothetical protein